MKQIHKQRERWFVPPPPPEVATFLCRSCGATLTEPLRRLDDPAGLASKELLPLVPAGSYWPVTAGHLPSHYDGVPVDFTGCYAVRRDALAGLGKHPDRQRWSGCCGPSGSAGPNRMCGCGRPVGTERSDCMWPVAVYLDPSAVQAVETEV